MTSCCLLKYLLYFYFYNFFFDIYILIHVTHSKRSQEYIGVTTMCIISFLDLYFISILGVYYTQILPELFESQF